MKNYWIVTRLLVRNMLRRGSKKDSGAIWAAFIGLGVLYLMVAGMMTGGTYMLGAIMGQAGMISQLITVLLSIGCMAVLIFGLISMLNTVYFSKDTEFFMALPVKPATVYLAKLTVVYAAESVLSILLLLPCLLTAGIVTHMGAVYYITMLFAMLIVPALPLLLASIIAIPLMYVVSFFRNKGVLSSIVLILLFGLFFGGYALLVNQISGAADNIEMGSAYWQQLAQSMEKPLVTFSNILFPLAAIARFATMTHVYGLSLPMSMLVNFAIFIGSFAVLIVLTVLISNAVYKRSAEKMLESGKRKVKENVAYSSSGVIKSLLKKEWRELIRTPAFAFQSLSGIIICPIMMIVVGFSFNRGVTEGSSPEEIAAAAQLLSVISGFMCTSFIAMMGIGMNIGAATCISREGEAFLYSKMIPVAPRDQLRAKSYLYLIISAVSIVAGLIVMLIMGGQWLHVLLSMGFLALYDYGYVHFVMYFDLCRPKLHWATPNEAVKNNRSAILPMFINIGVTFVIMIVSIMLTAIIPIQWLGSLISWIILYGIGMAGSMIFPSLLYNNAERLYAQLTV